MLYLMLKLVHLLCVVIWVGGMVFAQFFLRPSIASLAPPQRLVLMRDVLGRFFATVLVASLLTLASGAWMLMLAMQAGSTGTTGTTGIVGAAFHMPLAWTVMASLGVLMVAIFGHIRFVLYTRLVRAVAAQNWPAGGAVMAQIRLWVSVNLGLGLAIIAALKLAV